MQTSRTALLVGRSLNRARAVSLVLMLMPGCLMSSTPVDNPQPMGGKTTFRGQVMHVSGTSRTPARYTWVRFTWLRRSPDGGFAPITSRDLQGATGSGAFDVTTREGAVAGIQIDCLACRVNPGDPALACCFLDQPACMNCEALWTWHTEVHFQAGTENFQVLQVPCP